MQGHRKGALRNAPHWTRLNAYFCYLRILLSAEPTPNKPKPSKPTVAVGSGTEVGGCCCAVPKVTGKFIELKTFLNGDRITPCSPLEIDPKELDDPML